MDLEPHTDGATCCTTGVWTTHAVLDPEVDPLVRASICTNCITILKMNFVIFMNNKKLCQSNDNRPPADSPRFSGNKRGHVWDVFKFNNSVWGEAEAGPCTEGG